MGPADVGRPVHDLDTPVLLADLAVVEANIARLAAYCRDAGVQWRPHTKGQKVPALAHKEIAAGAIGVTCAKLGEAEVMAAAGIRDILVANQVVGTAKAARLAALLAHADVMVTVDSVENAEELSLAVARRGRALRVLVEVNVGMDRAGLEPGRAAVRFAEKVSQLPGLRFTGFMGWEGHCGGIPDAADKRRAIEAAVGTLVTTAELGRQAGLPVSIVSCGGTSTFHVTAHIAGVTEVQAGGGIFGDVLYRTRGIDHPFGLTVLSTVTSRPTPTRIIVDAGRKALSVDVALPRPKELAGVQSVSLSAEHGRIELAEPTDAIHVGDRLEWVVGYGDTTVCLHDEMVGVRDGIVETVWPILGRGKLT
jgi:D-serine deaminase-like pyridoxal phosphate-dependent protein